MKKRICAGLILALLFGLCGCAPAPAAEPLSVVTTIFPPYDLVRQIGGRRVSVTMLIPPGGEAHAFEPSFEDVAAIEHCDLFVYAGGESDAWVEQVLAVCDTARMTVVRLMDTLPLLAEADEPDEPDEHVWTTPQNALLMAGDILAGMQAADPAGREEYARNYEGLRERLQTICNDYEWLRTHNRRTLIIADRFPYLYLTEAYGLSYIAAFSGCTSNTEADLQTAYRLVDAARQQTHPVILCTETADGIFASSVAQAAGGRVRCLHSCHTVTPEEWKNGVTYCDLLAADLDVLKEALS